jgi:hypothetical protein
MSDGGRSSSQGIGAGASGRSTYRADEMKVSERLTGTYSEPLIALSSLISLRVSKFYSMTRPEAYKRADVFLLTGNKTHMYAQDHTFVFI